MMSVIHLDKIRVDRRLAKLRKLLNTTDEANICQMVESINRIQKELLNTKRGL
jgi:hypothetical protein